MPLNRVLLVFFLFKYKVLRFTQIGTIMSIKCILLRLCNGGGYHYILLNGL